MKEKHIEQSIVNYLKSIGAWVEQLQAGKVLIKKGAYNNMMTLCSNGTPDIVCLYQGLFYGIEVKNSQEEVNKWLKLELRYNNGEELPKSYKREKAQIEHKQNIIENGGTHILTWELREIIEYFNN